MDRAFLGIDIGGTKTAVLISDYQGISLASLQQKTVTGSGEQFLAGVLAAVDAALAQAQLSPFQLAAIGVGVPGQVDPENGRIQNAVNLNLRDFPLGARLVQALGAPVFAENDARLAALGAYQHLYAADSTHHLAYVSIGTGIAAGFVLAGKLYRGAHGMAGEIGHLPVQPNGLRCQCGQTGCLETIVTGQAIVRRGQAQLGAAKVQHAGDVYRLAAENQPAAEQIVAEVSRYLAQMIRLIVMSYDVAQIVLGGGVTQAGALFLRPLLAEMAKLRAESPLAASLLTDEKVTLLPAGFNPGLCGAVRLAQQQVAG